MGDPFANPWAEAGCTCVLIGGDWRACPHHGLREDQDRGLDEERAPERTDEELVARVRRAIRSPESERLAVLRSAGVDPAWKSVLWASAGEGPPGCTTLPDDAQPLAAVVDDGVVWAVLALPSGAVAYIEGDVDATWGNGGPGGVFDVALSLGDLLPRMSDEGRRRLGF